MTECRTPEMQDLLPDYVAASLSAMTAARVEQHLTGCAPCRDDVELLRVARVVRPRVAAVDVAQIVANLPRPTPVLRLIKSTAHTRPAPTPIVKLAPRTRRWAGSMWQVAAAVGVMIVGGTSLLVSRNSPVSLTEARSSDAQLAEAAERALIRTPGVGAEMASETVAVLGSPAGAEGSSRVSVSYGDLGDYSEAELQHMLDRLANWDGTSSTEPLPTLPVIPSSGGSAP